MVARVHNMRRRIPEKPLSAWQLVTGVHRYNISNFLVSGLLLTTSGSSLQKYVSTSFILANESTTSGFFFINANVVYLRVRNSLSSNV